MKTKLFSFALLFLLSCKNDSPKNNFKAESFTSFQFHFLINEDANFVDDKLNKKISITNLTISSYSFDQKSKTTELQCIVNYKTGFDKNWAKPHVYIFHLKDENEYNKLKSSSPKKPISITGLFVGIANDYQLVFNDVKIL